LLAVSVGQAGAETVFEKINRVPHKTVKSSNHLHPLLNRAIYGYQVL